VADVLFGEWFVWDAAKAALNSINHEGVTFPEAATVFNDPHYVLTPSPDGETVRAIGFSLAARVLTVVHAQQGERDRIISAWVATPAEQKLYEKGG